MPLTLGYLCDVKCQTSHEFLSLRSHLKDSHIDVYKLCIQLLDALSLNNRLHPMDISAKDHIHFSLHKSTVCEKHRSRQHTAL